MPYSGTSDSKLPKNIAKLSTKLKKIWVSSFNSAYKSSNGDEVYSFKVSNAAVKKASNKKESIEDIPVEAGVEPITEELEAKMNKGYDVFQNIVVSLQEGSIDKENRTADIVALAEGWSANGAFYDKSTAESMASLLSSRKKIFCNHTDEKKFGRDVLVWAATVQESIGKDGKAFAKIRFTDNPASAWLFEEAKQNPEEVQFSIDAIARVHEGKAPDGKEGIIVDKFIRLNSLDIVDYAAAGGVVQRTYASKGESELSIIKEAADTLKDRVSKYVEKDKLNILMNCFQDMLYSLSWTIEEEDDKSKKEKIGELVDEFLKEFNSIDVVKAFESKNKDEKDGDNMEITLEDVKKNPEIMEAIKKDIADSEASKAKEKEFDALTEKVTNLETELKDTQTKLQEKEAEFTTASESLNQYKFKEELIEKEVMVRGIVKESKLGNFDDLPEYIREDLKNKKDKESIETAVKALESLKGEESGKVEGVGETKAVEEEKKVDLSLADDKEAVARIFN